MVEQTVIDKANEGKEKLEKMEKEAKEKVEEMGPTMNAIEFLNSSGQTGGNDGIFSNLMKGINNMWNTNNEETIGGNEENIGHININKTLSESEKNRIVKGAEERMEQKKNEVELITAGVEDRMNNLGTTIPEGAGPAILTAGITLKSLGGLEKLNPYAKLILPVLIVILLYVVYILNRITLTGNWISNNKLQHLIISHNRFTNLCTIKFGTNGIEVPGFVKDKKIFLYLDKTKGSKPTELKLTNNYTKVSV